MFLYSSTHVPLQRKINKKELHLETKTWITPGIFKSIKRRDLILRKYVSIQNDTKGKDMLHTQYKILRYQIVAIIRKSKKLYYQKYFTENATH